MTEAQIAEGLQLFLRRGRIPCGSLPGISYDTEKWFGKYLRWSGFGK